MHFARPPGAIPWRPAPRRGGPSGGPFHGGRLRAGAALQADHSMEAGCALDAPLCGPFRGTPAESRILRDIQGDVMAIFHLTARIVSRGSGGSAVSTAAYNAGDRLRDVETGITIDKTKKPEVVFSEILLCENAPAEFCDREKLWNAVELKENFKNAQLARNFEFALPKELTDRQTQIEMVREYISKNFVAGDTSATRGMIADWSLHDKGDGNPHVHMMVTMRGFNPDGSWADYKKRSVYKLDADGQRIPKIDPATGEQAVRIRKGHGEEKLWEREYIPATPWSNPNMMEKWRSAWADCCNDRLDKVGIADRVDHRSFERQGINRIPTIHEGWYARHMESTGVVSDRCQENRIVKTTNHFLDIVGDRIENRDLVHMIIDKVRNIGTSITKVPRMVLALSKEIISEILHVDHIGKGEIENGNIDGRSAGGGAFRDFIRSIGLESESRVVGSGERIAESTDKRNGRVDQREPRGFEIDHDYFGHEERRDRIDAEDARYDSRIDRGL